VIPPASALDDIGKGQDKDEARTDHDDEKFSAGRRTTLEERAKFVTLYRISLPFVAFCIVSYPFFAEPQPTTFPLLLPHLFSL